MLVFLYLYLLLHQLYDYRLKDFTTYKILAITASTKPKTKSEIYSNSSS